MMPNCSSSLPVYIVTDSDSAEYFTRDQSHEQRNAINQWIVLLVLPTDANFFPIHSHYFPIFSYTKNLALNVEILDLLQIGNQ
jgi:hypothetical protein